MGTNHLIRAGHARLVQRPADVLEELPGIGPSKRRALLRELGSLRAVRTASVWQVRQPLYDQSLERWRRYASHLGPLERVLDGEDLPPAR